MTGPTIPRVAAYPADYPGNDMRMWCAWCDGWQYHSNGYGYCRPHIPRVGRQCPYQATGYILTNPSDLEDSPATRLDTLIAAVLDASKEEQGNILHWAVRRAAEMVNAGQLTHAQAVACFMMASVEVGISPAEADRTIMSALDLGAG